MVERREWALPQTVVQRFQPNEYVAACWKGICDKQGWIFIDKNNNNKADKNEYIGWSIGCGRDIIVKTDNNEQPQYNAQIQDNSGNVTDVYYTEHYNGVRAYHAVSYFKRDDENHS